MAYSPLTCSEVVLALELNCLQDGLSNCIAEEMLEGVTRFTENELHKLADFKGITLEELIKFDKQLEIYRDPVIWAKMAIIKNMLKKGFDINLALELTDFPKDMLTMLESA